MRKQDVVVLRQKARRSGGFWIRTRCVREIEELTAALIAKRDEAWSEPFDDRSYPGQTGPSPDIRGRRRPERGEIT
jgi:hypothetical protein